LNKTAVDDLIVLAAEIRICEIYKEVGGNLKWA